MNDSERIAKLQELVNELSAQVNATRVKLASLQSELAEIRKRQEPDAGHPAGPEKNIPASTLPGVSSNHAWLETFIGLRLVHLVGIVVLVIGISIGVKYAVDRQLISEGMRVFLAYLAGSVLFFISFRLRKKYALFSAILFSGSMATFYFTTYAAAVYYHFIPGIVAFFIMVALTVYTSLKAVDYNRREIAVIGMIGAYAIPFLVSNNQERTVLFFSYILVINLGIVYLSFRRSWQLMSQLATWITWVLFTGWALTRFEEGETLTAGIFMFLFFILFLASAIAFSRLRKISLSVWDIRHVLVNNIAFYVAAMIVYANGMASFKMAAVTGLMFLFTLLLLWLCKTLLPAEPFLHRLLSWQALGLLLLFISFEWDGLTVTLLWLAVSILLFTWGVQKKIRWARLASVFLVGITLVKLLVLDSGRFTTLQKIAGYLVIGVLLLLCSFYYQKLGLTRENEE